jgi:aryl sulfotransferase
LVSSTLTPARTAVYKGPITDTSRWENFKPRPDDIFICTPPKCGTTWTQAIVAMLIFGTPDHGEQPGIISPWIDADFAPIDEYLTQIQTQNHRRFIKTHTPLDGIPYFPECTYIVVCRDPRDMFFSLKNHQDNMADEGLAATLMDRGDTEFESWVGGSFNPENFDAQTLETPTHFLKTYWDYRDVSNIHLFHYFDMKQNLRGHIAGLAQILDIALDDSQLDAMTEAATFENMQAKGDQFAPGTGTGLWKKDAAFFATGKNSQWKDKLTPAQTKLFDEKIATLLNDDQRAWLLRS